MDKERERISSEAYRKNWRATGRVVRAIVIAFAILIAAIIVAAIINALTGNGTIGIAIVTIAAGAMILVTRFNPRLSFAGLGSRGLRIVAIGHCAFFGLATIGRFLPPPHKGRTAQALPSPVSPASSVTSTSPSRGGLRRLPPAERFEEYGLSDVHRHSQDLLNTGRVEEAYNLFESRNRNADSSREKRFDTVLEKAFQEASLITPGSTFADRINEYWLPKVRAIPDTPPVDSDGWRQLVSTFDELATDAADGETIPLTRVQLAAGKNFLAALGTKQAKLFPALRRHTATDLDRDFFRADTEVSVSGPQASTVTLTSFRFALNSNIADLEEMVEPGFTKARFKKVIYRSYPGSKSVFYLLRSPPDNAVALYSVSSDSFSAIVLK